MDLRIQPERWGCALFSLNVSPEVLKHYFIPETGQPDEQVNRVSYFDSLLDAVKPSGIQPPNLLYPYSVFGIHDLICVFRRAPDRATGKRHSVIESVAKWASQLAALKSDGGGREQLTASMNTTWDRHLTKICGEDTIKTIKGILTGVPGNKLPKVPALYNYTHDPLIPLYPADLDTSLKKPSSAQVLAFCFIRLDPRVMRIAGSGEPDCWSVYQKVERQLDEHQKNIVAVWAGLGMTQLVLMLSCASFGELADLIGSLRDEVFFELDFGRREPYMIINASSTLVAMPEEPTTSTHEIGFYILVRLLSGFHSHQFWAAIEEIAEALGFTQREFQIGGRQGLFDLVIRVAPDTAYEKVRKLIAVLECGCYFVADVATVMSRLAPPHSPMKGIIING